jgi:O-antigen ligase
MTLFLSSVFWLAIALAVPILLWAFVLPFFSGSLWVALRISPLTVLLAGPMLQPFSDNWDVGGVLVDPLDVVLVTLVGVLMLRKRRYARARIPYFRLWLALGLWTSFAYVCSPINEAYLTDPVRLLYQLYRYCWKPILYYPLTAFLVTDRKGFMRVMFVAVAVADVFAIQATIDGYTGLRATGPFGHGSNALGSALALPLLIAVARFSETTQRERWFYGLSCLLILRGLIFTGSRGAMIGAICGGALLFFGLRRTMWGRTHMKRVAQALAVAFVLVAVVRGNPLDRPSLQRFVASDANGESSQTFNWRLHERWPHFWKKVEQSPWVGVGTDSDLVFGKVGNTPHNGYLSIAVTSGVPALCLFLALAFACIASGWHAFRRTPRGWQGATGLTAAAGIVCVLIHNLVDTTVTLAFVAQIFWMLAATAARMGREATKVKVAVEPKPVPAPPVPLRSVRNA